MTPNGDFITRIVTENWSHRSNNPFENSIVDTKWPEDGVGMNTSSGFFMIVIVGELFLFSCIIIELVHIL